MKTFKERANKKIQEAVYVILKDAKFEIERNPNQEEEIKSFCEALVKVNNDFFKSYRYNKSNYKNKEDIEK